MTTARLALLPLLVLASLTNCRAQVDVLNDDRNGTSDHADPDDPDPSDPACDATWMRLATLSGAPSHLQGMCVDQPAQITPSGSADCFILDLRSPEDGCDCDPAKGFTPLDPSHTWAIDEANKTLASNTADWTCFCEVPQLTADPTAAKACESTPGPLIGTDGQPLNGFCLVDPALTPPRGTPEIVKNCPTDDQRMIRLVGAPGTLTNPGNRTLLFVCQTDTCTSP